MNLGVPSKFWRELSERDRSRVQGSWKRTVATHYFTWTRGDGATLLGFARLVGPQYILLLLHTTPVDWIRAVWGSWRKPAVEVGIWQGVEINLLARLAWFYARRTDRDGLTALTEPAAGDPFDIQVGGRCISQDLANSIPGGSRFSTAPRRFSRCSSRPPIASSPDQPRRRPATLPGSP